MNDCGKNDLYYAQHADRIVHLFDGLIVEEETGAQRLAAGGELKESSRMACGSAPSAAKPISSANPT